MDSEIKTPLIDEIYKKLYREKERVAANHNLQPKFQIYLSHEQLRQLKYEMLSPATIQIFTVNQDGYYLFGHKVIEVDDTPYIRLVE
jgi:hypothetical protein